MTCWPGWRSRWRSSNSAYEMPWMIAPLTWLSAEQRIDDRPAVLEREEALDADPARLGVDVDLGELHARRSCPGSAPFAARSSRARLPSAEISSPWIRRQASAHSSSACGRSTRERRLRRGRARSDFTPHFSATAAELPARLERRLPDRRHQRRRRRAAARSRSDGIVRVADERASRRATGIPAPRPPPSP